MLPAVVYLARKVDGMRWLPRFLASLRAFQPGLDYDLIVILKGYPSEVVPACLSGFRSPGLCRIVTMHFDDARFATDAFFEAAERFPYPAYLFFVSSARVLGEDWTRKMFAPLIEGRARLVGGSSGFESLNEQTSFPNPSIRTTGFAIRREDWLALERGDLSVRYGGNLFEAGPRSMTKQILGTGGTVLLVGRDGRTFPPADWAKSATFRLSRQENLLFADSRTEQFELARSRKRLRLAQANWGPRVSVVAVPLARVYGRRVRAVFLRLVWQFFGCRIISR